MLVYILTDKINMEAKIVGVYGTLQKAQETMRRYLTEDEERFDWVKECAKDLDFDNVEEYIEHCVQSGFFPGDCIDEDIVLEAYPLQ